MLLSPALATFVVAISELGTWKPATVVTAMFITLILLPPLIWRERSREDGIVDLHLFRIAPFLGGIIGVSASYALLYAMFFIMSFVFVRGLGLSPLSAGLHLAIIPIAIGVTAPVSGRIYSRLGSRVLTTAGMVMACLAIILLSHAAEGLKDDRVDAGVLALFGLGLGIYIAPNNAATMAAAPEGRSSQAGGLINLMRVLGCVAGIVIASSSLAWRLRVDTSFAKKTLEVPTAEILAAACAVLWVLLFFAILAGGASLMKNRRGQLEFDASASAHHEGH